MYIVGDAGFTVREGKNLRVGFTLFTGGGLPVLQSREVDVWRLTGSKDLPEALELGSQVVVAVLTGYPWWVELIGEENQKAYILASSKEEASRVVAELNEGLHSARYPEYVGAALFGPLFARKPEDKNPGITGPFGQRPLEA